MSHCQEGRVHTALLAVSKTAQASSEQQRAVARGGGGLGCGSLIFPARGCASFTVRGRAYLHPKRVRGAQAGQGAGEGHDLSPSQPTAGKMLLHVPVCGDSGFRFGGALSYPGEAGETGAEDGQAAWP